MHVIILLIFSSIFFKAIIWEKIKRSFKCFTFNYICRYNALLSTSLNFRTQDMRHPIFLIDFLNIICALSFKQQTKKTSRFIFSGCISRLTKIILYYSYINEDVVTWCWASNSSKSFPIYKSFFRIFSISKTDYCFFQSIFWWT